METEIQVAVPFYLFFFGGGVRFGFRVVTRHAGNGLSWGVCKDIAQQFSPLNHLLSSLCDCWFGDYMGEQCKSLATTGVHPNLPCCRGETSNFVPAHMLQTILPQLR